MGRGVIGFFKREKMKVICCQEQTRRHCPWGHEINIDSLHWFCLTSDRNPTSLISLFSYQDKIG